MLDLNAVVLDTERILARTIGDHIEVVLNLSNDLRPVWADAGQLQRVVLNLAVNSRDAMPAGGMITIDTKNVELERGRTGSGGDLRAADRQRHRGGHDARGARADLRPVLHDEARGRRNRARPGNRVRHRQSKRRTRHGVQPAQPRLELQGLLAGVGSAAADARACADRRARDPCHRDGSPRRGPGDRETARPRDPRAGRVHRPRGGVARSRPSRRPASPARSTSS